VFPVPHSRNTYVKLEDVKFYFTITNGEVAWTDAEGNAVSQQNLVSYESNTFLVGNRAGVSLPATGGAGTLAYRLGGIMLITVAAVLLLLSCCVTATAKSAATDTAALAASKIPSWQWQLDVTFPDWKGSINTSFAVNNRIGFYCYAGQGVLYLQPDKNCGAFSLYVNGTRVSTKNAVPAQAGRRSRMAERAVPLLALFDDYFGYVVKICRFDENVTQFCHKAYVP
jgi:hypothetical protein